MTIIIAKNGKKAIRLPRQTVSSEAHIQKYILDNPEVLALEEIKEGIELSVLTREFPTESGSIDAVALDGDADIYIIETKLFKNRDKRAVVAQALDYGASLWRNIEDSDLFIASLDTRVARHFGVSLEEKITSDFGLDDERLITFIDTLKDNLRSGAFKFVILMDRLHRGLKDLILFINTNSRFSVYAIEIDMYQYEGSDVIVPKVFGAEARKSGIGTESAGRLWDEDSFFDLAVKELNTEELEAIRALFVFARESSADISWGRGKQNGSFSPKYAGLGNRTIFNCYTDGYLYFPLYSFEDDSNYKVQIESILGRSLKGKWPGVPSDVWVSKVKELISFFQGLMAG